MCVHMCMYVYTCITCMCESIHVCIYVCVHVCMFACMCTCIHMCVCVCEFVHVCMCVHMYTCICVSQSANVLGLPLFQCFVFQHVFVHAIFSQHTVLSYINTIASCNSAIWWFIVHCRQPSVVGSKYTIHDWTAEWLCVPTYAVVRCCVQYMNTLQNTKNRTDFIPI